MPRFSLIISIFVLIAMPAAAQTTAPDLRGTWKGESETIVLGSGNPHHAAPSSPEPRLSNVGFTLTITRQDGRRFSGSFSSARSTDALIGVVSRSGTIFVVDDDGYTVGTMLAPNRMELCYLHLSASTRLASCVELTKQQ